MELGTREGLNGRGLGAIAMEGSLCCVKEIKLTDYVTNQRSVLDLLRRTLRSGKHLLVALLGPLRSDRHRETSERG